jgi:predicted  nucleic acid-binding Zn-ribbon protein
MDKSKYDRNVTLVCPTCGGTQFEYEDDTDGDEAIVRCIGCDRELTTAELIDQNAENLEENAKEIADEVVKDYQRELDRMLKRAFRK